MPPPEAKDVPRRRDRGQPAKPEIAVDERRDTAHLALDGAEVVRDLVRIAARRQLATCEVGVHVHDRERVAQRVWMNWRKCLYLPVDEGLAT